jgi:hypothetical protein
LYPALIIALANAAPYFKNLTVTSSTRLLQLFTSFSNPLFLLADEGHPRLLFFMRVLFFGCEIVRLCQWYRLEVFNAVIQHHLSENPNLVYAILTAHKAFEDLGTFTLSKGLHEIKRVQITREEQARVAKGKQRRTRTAGDDVEGDAQGEKARLMENWEANAADAEGAQQGEKATPKKQQVNTTDVDLERGLDPVELARSQQQGGVSTDNQPPLPLSSPTEAASAVSEKARGKMKARRSMSLDTTGSLERIAASGVGRNGFVPTEEWVRASAFDFFCL